jgi:hypothetical protein
MGMHRVILHFILYGIHSKKQGLCTKYFGSLPQAEIRISMLRRTGTKGFWSVVLIEAVFLKGLSFEMRSHFQYTVDKR